MTKSFVFLMKHDKGIPLIMKAMMVPSPVQSSLACQWTLRTVCDISSIVKDHPA